MKLKYLYIFSFLLLSIRAIAFGDDNEKTAVNQYSGNDIEALVDSLGKQCWALRGVDSDSSLMIGLKAVGLAKEHSLEKQIAKISNYVGVVYMHYLYRYKKAIPYFQNAMHSSMLLKDSVQLAYSYNNLGDVYLMGGNIPLAMQYGQASLDIFLKLKHEDGIAYGYINLAEAYRAKKDHKTSLAYFEKATSIRKVNSSNTNTGFVLFNKAKTFEQLENLEDAKRYYQEALGLSYDTPDLRYVSWCLTGIADIYYKQGDYLLAKDFYKKALKWDEGRVYEYGIVDSYIGLALVHAHKNEVDQGELLLQKALSLAEKLEINTLILKSYNSYFEFYKILGDLENVTRSFDIFLSQYDSILSAQQFDIINELEQNYTVHQELLSAEQELSTNKFRRERLLAIIFLMLVVMVVLIWQYRSHKRLNKKLEEMNSTKDRLFSVISHDLRNPFNSLIGFSEILLDNLKDKNYEGAEQYAGYLNKSSNEGFNMLNNLLDWSMSQSGRIQFKPQYFSAPQFFADLESYFEAQDETYKVKLSVDNTINGNILADANIIRIVLINLVTNAFKYTPEGGLIIVTAAIENSKIKLVVNDSGIGMSNETIEKLFNKKNNIKSERGLRNEKGIGLGLRIIRELLHIHKGTINVSSKLGSGTTFELHFPVGI